MRSRLVAVALVVGSVLPLGVTAAAPTCAAASGQVRIAIVVDFGDLPNPPPTSKVCVAVGDRDNGAKVLSERAKLVGTPQPRYASSGLLCAIDGLPAKGCGEQTGAGFADRAYFHGSKDGWTYANDGPAGHRVKAGESEGWHFVEGSGAPIDPAPRASADPATICKPPPVATTTTTSHQSTRSSPTTTTTVMSGPGPATAASESESERSGTPADESSTTVMSTSTSRPESSTSTTGEASNVEENAAIVETDDGGGGPPLGALAGAAGIAALAIGGAVIARRRRST